MNPRLMVMWAALALVLAMPKAWGQALVEQDPVSATQDIRHSWDRSALPAEVLVWRAPTLLAFNPDPDLKYGQLFLTCQSAHSAIEGACATEGTTTLASGYSAVTLQATERRSGLTAQLVVQGALMRAIGSRACGDWLSVTRPLNTALGERCVGDASVGTGATLFIPSQELSRLVAGRWTAVMVLRLHKEQGGPEIARYTFNFDFTITDHNAASIYFPLFHNVSPLVGLNAVYDPVAKTIGGRTAVDMCLYDGLGSQAEYLGITARHVSARPPGASGFSLWQDAAGSDEGQRLDYTVTLNHNGSTVPLANGREAQLRGIDTAQLRLVMLPGMNLPVFCVPTPMTVEIPPVPIATKRPGIYWGDLQVELRVPTATP